MGYGYPATADSRPGWSSICLEVLGARIGGAPARGFPSKPVRYQPDRSGLPVLLTSPVYPHHLRQCPQARLGPCAENGYSVCEQVGMRSDEPALRAAGIGAFFSKSRRMPLDSFGVSVYCTR
jgi:hypothetical protein